VKSLALTKFVNQLQRDGVTFLNELPVEDLCFSDSYRKHGDHILSDKAGQTSNNRISRISSMMIEISK
jgi:hypothetical protein